MSKEEKELKSIISKVRATAMEGSFGTLKTAYGLNKIKAKTAANEIVWMFFATMATNAVNISKRKAPDKESAYKQAA